MPLPSAHTILDKAFYTRPPIDVARDILGKILQVEEKSCRIIEVEAYLGFSDPASRVRRCDKVGRRLYDEPGTIMLYSIHGHIMVNIISHPEWMPGSVFIRGCIINGKRVIGPGRVSRILGFSMEYDGVPVYVNTSPVKVLDDGARPGRIEALHRIGVREDLELPLRYRARSL